MRPGSAPWCSTAPARSKGVTPDLDLHCARVNRSAESFCLKPFVSLDTWIGLAHEGIKRFDANAELYIRPMYWAETGSLGGIRHDPESTRWCLSIYEAPLPKPTGFCAHAVAASGGRPPNARRSMPRPAASIPTTRARIIEAQARGFDNCLMCDMLGNVAELGTANVFMAKDGVVYTPVAERHLPQRHHAAARDRAAARRRRRRWSRRR